VKPPRNRIKICDSHIGLFDIVYQYPYLKFLQGGRLFLAAVTAMFLLCLVLLPSLPKLVALGMLEHSAFNKSYILHA
jgi:hypothetical protein